MFKKKYEKMFSLTGSQGTTNPNKNKMPFYKLSKLRHLLVPVIIRKADKQELL